MSNSTYVFGAADAKIASLLTDTSEGATYGDAIDVPGLKSIAIKGSSDTKELRGDNRLLAKVSTLQSIEVTLEFAKWDADIYALFTGATKTTDGSDYRVTLTSTSTAAPFKLTAVSAGASGAGSNVDIVISKLIVTDLPDMVGLSEEDFKTVSVTCEALPLANGEWMSYGYNAEGLSL